MINNIDLLKMAALMSNNSTKSCNCNCNKGSQGFDMLMLNLLKAIASTQQTTSNQNIYRQATTNQNGNLETANSIHNSNKVQVSSKNEDTKTQIENAISISSKKYGVDENLIKSIIKVESDFNPNCVSSAGAKGLMQLMPENCRDLGVTNPFDINQNIDGGTRHIKEYLDKYNGDTKMALMAYNGGPTRMSRRGVKSVEDIYLMPKETQRYVPKVMKYYIG
ncbi:MAG: lytic transglycosylase domain-containing protein [Clostridia bacterium]